MKPPSMDVRSAALAMPTDVAIVGIASRFPGAADPVELWRMLIEEREGVERLTEDEVAALPHSYREDPGFVPVTGRLPQVGRHDVEALGMTEEEARRTDPQHLLALELAIEALDAAGFSSEEEWGPVGVFAGCPPSALLQDQLRNAYHPTGGSDPAGSLDLRTRNAPDYLPLRMAHLLDLTGPCEAIGATCATGLAAVHAACRALLADECDAAIAAAASLRLPEDRGYLSVPDGPFSRDGRTRAFGEGATGPVFTQGGAAIVLRRLDDALADGNPVLAVIRGSAEGNDGAGRAGFTAPSAEGQARVIAEAQGLAGVEPREIGMIEAHGTGTRLGDPIEFRGLDLAFGSSAEPWCALGSIKSAIGHSDTASGLAGLIKAVGAVRSGWIPRTLFTDRPNPELELQGSAFRLAAEPGRWPDGTRFAGVSSFGIGGVNVHAVIGPAPGATPLPRPSRSIWLFAGGGAQWSGMAGDMYESDAAYRDAVDALAERVHRLTGHDPRSLLLGAPDAGNPADPLVGLPALFVAQVATARALMARGAAPAAVLGHSVGEYAAAVIGGVLDEDSAVRIVSARASLMREMPEGEMLATSMPGPELAELLREHPEVDIAAVNAPSAHVLAGPSAAIGRLRADVVAAGAEASPVGVSAAAHSRLIEPILPAFREAVRGVPATTPRIPMYSTLTGGLLDERTPLDAGHWIRHLRSPVQFDAALRAAVADYPGVVLQVGPGTGLARLARSLPGVTTAIPTTVDRRQTLGDCGSKTYPGNGGAVSHSGVAALARAFGELLPNPFEGVAVRRRTWRRRDCVDPHRLRPDFPAVPVDRDESGDARDPGSGLLQRPRWMICDDDVTTTAPADAVIWIAGEDLAEHVGHLLAEAGCTVRGVEGRGTPDGPIPDLIVVDDSATGDLGARGCGEEAVTAHLMRTARLLDQLAAVRAREGDDDDVRWVQLTNGAERITDRDDVDPVSTAVTGVPRVAGQETPGLIWRTIDVDSGYRNDGGDAIGPALVRDILGFLDGGAANRHRAVRGGVVLERSWQPVDEIGDVVPFTGACAIIGGTGAVGIRLARTLLSRGRRVALISRTDPGEDVADILRNAGESATWHRADAADEGELGAALRAAAAAHGVLGAVVHAAVDVDVVTFREMLDTSPGSSLNAKVAGSDALADALAAFAGDDASPGESPVGTGAVVAPRVLLMSSAAGTIGGFGLSGYVAASRYLDGTALSRPGWVAVDWDRLRRGDADEAAAASEVTMRHAIDIDDAVNLIVELLDRDAVPRHLAASPDELNTRSAHLDVTRRQRVADAVARAPQTVTTADGSSEVIAGAWAGVLGRSPSSDQDDFFASGGHSLLATKLLADIRSRTGVELRLRDVLDNPTAGGLAALLRSAAADGGGAVPVRSPNRSDAPAVSDTPDPEGDFDLTRVQHAYWVGRDPSYESGGVGCHFFLEYRAADLDLGRYESAWAETIRRHPMLRAVITEDGRQRVLPFQGFTLTVHDFRDSTDATERLADIRTRLANRVADPGTGPMLLPEVVRIPGADHVLISVDVISCDSGSWMLVDDEIRRRYEDPSWEPEPLGLTFAECVPVLNGTDPRSAARHAADRAWWLERVDQLADAPDLGARAVDTPRFTRLAARIPKAQWASIRHHAGDASLTPTAVVLRAYADELSDWSADERFSLTLTVFDRPEIHPDVNRVVGEFSTMMILPCLGHGGSFLDRTRELQRHLMEGLDHRRFGGLELLAELSRRRGRQVNVPVVFTGMLGLDASVGGHDHAWLGEPVGGLSQTPQVWLDHQAYEHRGDLVLQWDVSSALDLDTARERFDSYVRRLRVMADPEPWRGSPSDGTPTDATADDSVTDPRETVLEAWREVLGGDLPDPLPDDASFLSLGGDSLLAVRMANVIRGRTGIRLPLRHVRADVTVAELVERLTDLASGSPAGVPGISGGGGEQGGLPAPGAAGEPFPLTPLQQAYFVGQQGAFDGSYATAHVTTDVALHGIRETDPGALRELLTDACRRIGERHPMLRLRVLPDGTQRIAPETDRDAGIEVLVSDFRDVSCPEGELRRLRERLITDGPDPVGGTTALVGVTLLPEGEARLHVSSSLLAVDGWSASLLDRDLLDIIAGRPVAPEPRLTFRRYLELLSGPDTQERRRRDTKWWEDRIPTLPPAPALPGRPLSGDRMEMLEDRLGPGDFVAFRRHATEHGVTPSQALLTAFAVALAEVCGQDAMLLTTLQHDRRMVHDDVARIIGPFSRTALVAPDLSGGGAFSDLARHVAAGQAEFDAHPEVSAVEITRAMPRRGSRGAVAPVVFQSTVGMDASLGGDLPADAGPLGELDVRDYVQGLRTPQVELELRCFDLRGELVLSIAAMPRDEDVAGRLLNRVARIVHGLATGDGWHEHHDPRGRSMPATPGDARPVRVPGEVPGGPIDMSEEPGWADVVTCWCRVLGTDQPPASNQDFFASGGDSLLAVRLVGAVRSRGIDADLRNFLDDPTPRTLLGMHGVIGDAGAGTGVCPDPGEADWPTPRVVADCVQTLRRGRGRPVFLLHPSGGDVLCYMGIARLGASGRPVLGLSDPGLAGHEVPPGIPALVDLYVAAIMREQPDGPITLGGWSMGGTLGQEVARRLRERQRTVDLLIMIDSNSPARIRRLTGAEEEICASTRLRHLRSIAAFLGLDSPDGDVDDLMPRLIEAGAFRDAFNAEQRLGVFTRHLDGLGDHEAAVLDESVPVLLIRAGGASPCNSGEGMGVDDADEPLLGWSGLLLGPVVEHVVEGHHYSLLRDPALAEVVRLLDEALRRWSGDAGAGQVANADEER